MGSGVSWALPIWRITSGGALCIEQGFDLSMDNWQSAYGLIVAVAQLTVHGRLGDDLAEVFGDVPLVAV